MVENKRIQIKPNYHDFFLCVINKSRFLLSIGWFIWNLDPIIINVLSGDKGSFFVIFCLLFVLPSNHSLSSGLFILVKLSIVKQFK